MKHMRKKFLFACLLQAFLQLQRRKNNHDFATGNQLGNGKKSDVLFLQQNFRRLLKAVLNRITIRNFSASVFALTKVDCTVSDLVTNYLFMRLKPKQNTTDFHVARTLKFTS